ICFPVHRLRGLPLRSGPHDPAWQDAADAWPAIARALDEAGDTLAAIVYEPVLQAAGGMRFYSPDLLRRLRAWADARGVFLIADEIAAGMGRLGAMLAGHLAPGVWPDFAVVSKGLTAGVLPLSAVLTTDAIYALFDSDYADGKAFLHSNTFTGNALAVAVGNAVLDVFADEQILARAAALETSLRARLPAPATPSTGRRFAAAPCCARWGTRCTSSRRSPSPPPSWRPSCRFWVTAWTPSSRRSGQ